jgi:uncharacterized membrane protein YjgN (DUF898 family)
MAFVIAFNPILSTITVLALVLWAVFAWLVMSTALMRRAADSYRAVRDELREMAGTRVQQEVLDELRMRLRAVDDSTDRAAPVAAPTVRSDLRWLLRRPQRLIPPIVALLTLIDVCLASAAQGGAGVLILFAALATVISGLLAFDGARLSLTLLAGVRLAQSGHRSEAEHLLAEAEKTAKKRVAGLGDRVARALEILRKQQDS